MGQREKSENPYLKVLMYIKGELEFEHNIDTVKKTMEEAFNNAKTAFENNQLPQNEQDKIIIQLLFADSENIKALNNTDKIIGYLDSQKSIYQLGVFFSNPESFTTEVKQNALQTAAKHFGITIPENTFNFKGTEIQNNTAPNIVDIYEKLADDNQKTKFNEIYQKFLKKEHGTDSKILDEKSELFQFMQKDDAHERLNSNKWQSQVAGQNTNINQNAAKQKIYARCDLKTLSAFKEFGEKEAQKDGKDPYSLTTGEKIMVALASIVGIIIGGVALHSHFKEQHKKENQALKTELQLIVTSSKEAPEWAEEATRDRRSNPNKNPEKGIGKFTEGVVKTTPSTKQQR